MDEGPQVARGGDGRTAGLAAMRVQRNLRQKVLPGPPSKLHALQGGDCKGREGWVPEPRAVAHPSETKVCIMRVQGKRLRPALQLHRLLPRAPQEHDAGAQEAGSEHEAASRGS